MATDQINFLVDTVLRTFCSLKPASHCWQFPRTTSPDMRRKITWHKINKSETETTAFAWDVNAVMMPAVSLLHVFEAFSGFSPSVDIISLEKTFLRAFSSCNLHCGDAQVQLRVIILSGDALYGSLAFFEFALTLCATWFKSVFELYFVHIVKSFLPQRVNTAKTQSAQKSGTTTFVNNRESAVFDDLNEYFCCWRRDRQWNRSWRRCSHGPTSIKQHRDDYCKITVALWEA